MKKKKTKTKKRDFEKPKRYTVNRRALEIYCKDVGLDDDDNQQGTHTRLGF